MCDYLGNWKWDQALYCVFLVYDKDNNHPIKWRGLHCTHSADMQYIFNQVFHQALLDEDTHFEELPLQPPLPVELVFPLKPGY